MKRWKIKKDRPPIWEGDFLRAGDFELTDTDEIGKIKLVSKETPGPQHSDGRFGLLLSERGDVLMPITLTFHIFGLTVTIRINGRNRHSGK